ncbi:hypothetical protein BG97_4824 [Burkholderia pseudomallei 7894]|nr:hypothetical protein BG97_4824 [Burkholderia pseudomallei 7894]
MQTLTAEQQALHDQIGALSCIVLVLVSTPQSEGV